MPGVLLRRTLPFFEPTDPSGTNNAEIGDASNLEPLVLDPPADIDIGLAEEASESSID